MTNLDIKVMDKKFSVILYSKIRFVCILLPSWLSGFPLAMLLIPHGLVGQLILGILAVVLVFSSLFVFPKYIAKAILHISFDTEAFQLDWVKPYWGSKLKSAQQIRFYELKSYKYESSYNFSTLELRLRSGSKIQLHRWYNDNNDDFDKFMTQFKRSIESYNKKKSTIALIEKEKSIMENKTFLLGIGILVGVLCIATILLLIFKGVSNIKGIIPILIVLGPLIWVVSKIIKGFKKAKIK